MMDAAGMAALQGPTPVGLSPSAMSDTQRKTRGTLPPRNHAPKMTGASSPTHSNRSRAKQIAMGGLANQDTSGGNY